MRLSKVKGVSLIEVMVTTLILGIGLLGVAALQMSSINTNQSGYYRSQATSISIDLSARIRSAKSAYYGGSSVNQIINAYTETPYLCDAAAKSCIANSCTEAEVVAFDKWEVCEMAKNLLPDGEVYVIGASGIRMKVAIAWTPVESRQDLGLTDNENTSNTRCADANVPADSGKDCVILEVVP